MTETLIFEHNEKQKKPDLKQIAQKLDELSALTTEAERARLCLASRIVGERYLDDLTEAERALLKRLVESVYPDADSNYDRVVIKDETRY